MASITVEPRCILLPIGTKISISLASGQVLPMLAMGNDMAAALFPVDDVDFLIDVDNTRSSKGITFEVTINNNSHWYSVGPGVRGESMKALVHNGRKLHFKSQATHDGRMLVAATADKYAMRYDDASVMCCKIKFHVKVEKPLERIQPRRVLQQSYGYNDPTRPFRSCSGYGMHDFFDSANGSNNTPGNYEGMDCYPSFNARRFGSGHSSAVGEHGIICYGEESNQVYETSSHVKIDDMYVIKPFVIELRMGSKYVPV